MLRRTTLAAIVAVLLSACGSDGDAAPGGIEVSPSTQPQASWFMVADVIMKDRTDFRIIVHLADQGVNVDRDRCGDTVSPGTVNQFATISIENQSDRDAPLPEVSVSLEVDGQTVGAQWKPGPNDNCGVAPWDTTYGDYSNSIRTGDTKTNPGSFSGTPENPTSDGLMTVTVNEANVIGGGGQVFTDTVPASELGGG